MLLPPQTGVVYGPVRSRRLGVSLGINALPPRGKVCTFDCLYCQYGWTDETGAGVAYPSVAEVLEGVEAALAACAAPPAHLTFSGNGEPTLHPRFTELVDGVIRIRDRRAPSARTAVLSNGTRVGDPSIREALGRLDVRIMKLDAGTDETLRRFNRPAPGISIDEIVDGLRSLGGVTIQSLFAAGPAGNSTPADIEAWVRRVVEISPVAVQIYTLDREWPSELIEPLDAAGLEAILAAGAAAVQAPTDSSMPASGGRARCPGAARRRRNSCRMSPRRSG